MAQKQKFCTTKSLLMQKWVFRLETVSIQKDAGSIMHARRHLTPQPTAIATFLIMKVVAVDCNVVSALSVVWPSFPV